MMTPNQAAKGCPVLHFKPDAPGFDADPYPAYTELRESAPVYFWPDAQAYVVSRFDDVASMLRDPRLATDPVAAGLPAPEAGLPEQIRAPFERSLFRLAPRDHARVRRAVSPAFTPRACDRLRPMIQRTVDEALAPFEGKDEIEIAEFADFIPLRVVASMLDIPGAHEKTFRDFGEALIRTVDPCLTPEMYAAVVAPVPAGMTLLRELIAERRDHLGDDLLSTLIRAEAEGDRLSEDEMLGLVAAIIAAGSETTVHFICFGVMSLLCVPERAAAVRAEPALLRGAMEELLRFDNFGKGGVVRYCLEDVEIAGVQMSRGSTVVAILPAALRDPRAIADADRYDPRRQQEEILSFGLGPHYCLGASLARLEGEIAIGTLLRRYADMRVVGEPTYARHPTLRKLSSLRVAVTPAARSEVA
ncbi:cytochrome P450 [Sorangium sp. So ce1078]|uniref:cytochrome P450 n=1 Tax=Sorangium sp. So ce1078 TaxID=3133329 RepID=UPI003F612324